ncbi:Lactoylglutathione lyase [Nymphon striatum]|nr:Lactoylglutathione lyase [Nymphon striatum]
MASGISNEEAEKACSAPEKATEDFMFQHTMIRIKDPKASLDFYTRVLGMRLLQKLDFEAMKFTLFFLGYEKKEDIPSDPNERKSWTFSRKGVVELCHNWGTENDPEFKYHNGNADPKGFGHLAIRIPDTEVTCQRMESLNVKFIKKPNEGKMKGIAFILDPDGYWIELIDEKSTSEIRI